MKFLFITSYKNYNLAAYSQKDFMLNRRIIRIKVMQSLYACLKGHNMDLAKGERQLLTSVNKLYELYLSFFNVLIELHKTVDIKIIDGTHKLRPTEADLHPNKKFLNNGIFKVLSENLDLQSQIENHNISWKMDTDELNSLYLAVKSSQEYNEYMAKNDGSFAQDRKMIINVFIHQICRNQNYIDIIEDSLSISLDDIEFIASMVIKTLKSFKDENAITQRVFRLYKNETSDKAFLLELFHKSIKYQDEFDEYIRKISFKWDMERIAFIDILLIKMALTEMVYFPTIPIKSSLDEYIDISKYYSTQKSNIFINGILDRLVKELLELGKIKKTGRGLIT